MKHTFKVIVFILIAFSVNAQTTVRLKAKQMAGLMTNNPNSIDPGRTLFGGSTWTCNSTLCIRHSFIEFDLSSIPTNATIDSASLYLYGDPADAFGHSCFSNCSGQNNYGWLRRVTAAWNQSTVTWNTQPPYATVNQLTVPASSDRNQNYILDLTTMVSDMVLNPSSNHGFMMMMKDEVNYYQQLLFAGSGNPDTTLVPVLKVTYTIPTNGCVLLKAKQMSGLMTNNPDSIDPGATLFGGSTWTCNSILCIRHSFIEFDLSSIPTTATIDSASLYLYGSPTDAFGHSCFSNCSGQNNYGWLRRVTAAWNKNTVTWNTQPPYSTTNQLTVPASIDRNENYILNVTPMVSDMVMNPSTNHGFMMMMKDEVNYYQQLLFAGSGHPDTSLVPRLKVCYTVQNGVSSIVAHPLRFFPNPTEGKITINFDQPVHGTIRIFNSLGAEVFSIDVNRREITFDSHLNPGVYFVQLRTNESQWTEKLIVNR